MPQVAGITTKKNVRGELTHVTINIKKHKEAITPMLEKLGVISKTPFQKEFEKGIPLEEARQKLLTKVRTLWGK
jgi:hypothetical protein